MVEDPKYNLLGVGIAESL